MPLTKPPELVLGFLKPGGRLYCRRCAVSQGMLLVPEEIDPVYGVKAIRVGCHPQWLEDRCMLCGKTLEEASKQKGEAG